MTEALTELLPALQRLDGLLQQAIVAAEATYGPDATVDHFRGLYINRQQAEQLLTRQPGQSLLNTAHSSNGQESRAVEEDDQPTEESPETETTPEESGPFGFIGRLFRSERETAVDQTPPASPSEPIPSEETPAPPQPSPTTTTMPSAVAGERQRGLLQV